MNSKKPPRYASILFHAVTLHHCKIHFFVATGGKRTSTGNVGQASASRANRDGKPSKSRNVNVLRNGRPGGSFAGRFGFTLPPSTHFTNKTHSPVSLFSLFFLMSVSEGVDHRTLSYPSFLALGWIRCYVWKPKDPLSSKHRSLTRWKR